MQYLVQKIQAINITESLVHLNPNDSMVISLTIPLNCQTGLYDIELTFNSSMYDGQQNYVTDFEYVTPAKELKVESAE